MDRYGLWVALAAVELVGIFAVANPSALMEWMTPQIKSYQYPKMKPILKLIGWGFVSLPLLILVGFYFSPRP